MLVHFVHIKSVNLWKLSQERLDPELIITFVFLTPFTPCFTDCYKVSWMNYPKASLNESLFVFSRYISCQVSCDGIQLKLTYSKTLPMHDSVTELETTSNIKRCQNRVCISEVTLRQWLNFAQWPKSLYLKKCVDLWNSSPGARPWYVSISIFVQSVCVRYVSSEN